MKQLLLLLAFIFGIALFAGAQKTDTVKKIKLPRGIILKDNQVTVSGKYFVEKTDSGTQIMYRKRNGGGFGATGNIDCSCTGGGSGDCVLEVATGSAKCKNNTCQNCKLVVIINSGSSIKAIQ